MPTRPQALIATAAAALLLAGCGMLGGSSDPTPAPDPTTAEQTAEEEQTETPATDTLLPEGTTEVQVSEGETVQVSLGQGSPGIGDDWGVISQSPEGVAQAEVVAGKKVAGDQDTSDAPGGSMPYAVQITGETAGTSTVRVLYCTRSRIEEGCDQDKGTLEAPVEPVEITVTVQ